MQKSTQCMLTAFPSSRERASFPPRHNPLPSRRERHHHPSQALSSLDQVPEVLMEQRAQIKLSEWHRSCVTCDRDRPKCQQETWLPVASRKSQAASCKLQQCQSIETWVVNCRMSQMFLRLLVEEKKEKGNRWCLRPMREPVCSHVPADQKSTIPAVHSALFQLELADPLRLNSTPL